MGTVAKCGICGDTVIYRSSDIKELGEHLYRNHTEKSLINFQIEHVKADSSRSLKSSGSSKTVRTMYKTTVETWKPGISVLTCPNCQKTGHPIVRKQQNKIAHSSLGAVCLLGCWPLCFLPFMLGGSNTMNIHCKFCGQYLGTFDRKTGRMKSPDNTYLDKPPNEPCGCDCQCKV